MEWNNYKWSVEALAKFSLLGGPATVILWKWSKIVPVRKNLYSASLINLVMYTGWLLAMCLMSILSNFQSFLWIKSSDLAVNLAVFVPLLFLFGSVGLLVLSLKKKEEERQYPAFYSALMVALWLVSLVIPN